MAFAFTADVKIKDGDNARAVENALQALRETQVLIGIPEAEAGRDGNLTNVDLLYIHSNGSPLVGIPARPVIEPALENSKEKLGELMSAVVQAAASGDLASMQSSHEKAGLAGEAIVRDWFTNPANAWAPNSPETKKAKERKGSTDPKPLIDTGEFRRSITYVVRKEGG